MNGNLGATVQLFNSSLCQSLVGSRRCKFTAVQETNKCKIKDTRELLTRDQKQELRRDVYWSTLWNYNEKHIFKGIKTLLRGKEVKFKRAKSQKDKGEKKRTNCPCLINLLSCILYLYLLKIDFS